jgi:hypothetical protein
MLQYIGTQTRPLALCLAIGVVVCSGACEASRDGGARAVGEAQTVAVTTGSLALKVSAGALKRGAVPSGAAVVLLSNVNVCASAYHPGDSFMATVADTSRSPSGAVIPAGSLATFRVTAVTPPSTEHPGTAQIGIALDSLDIDGVRYPAAAHIKSIVTRRVRTPRTVPGPARTPGHTRGAGVLSEPLGRDLTRSGAGAGSSAHTASAPQSTQLDVCIPRHGRIATVLDGP